ncbi:nucleoside triphosphate pyrophosphohydrolase [Sphingorhabdus arenilitoris]|uniref:Nucleoside triphosphate pyrophosphohydrolase n=1 Tax=Sphingorhabdus arenilitoris TaxID=1490041 RepID=A0ABV8RGR0_9SPHN
MQQHENPMQTLLSIMAKLRDPRGGCPWDLEQDFASIAPYTIEEAYEVADAIERGDIDALKDELGDLLLQVVFHSQMAAELGHFDIDDVAQAISDKMIRRHPHVFGNEDADDPAKVVSNWEAIKAAERADKDTDQSALAGVALALPALLRAQKIQKRAARIGFDWPDVAGAVLKLSEEIDELHSAQTEAERFEEMGDLLFAAVNVARHHGIDAEAALKAGTAKFERRFRAMEQNAGEEFAAMTLDEKEAEWQAVKKEAG